MGPFRPSTQWGKIILKLHYYFYATALSHQWCIFFHFKASWKRICFEIKIRLQKEFHPNFRTSADLWPCAMSILSNLTLIARKWNCFVKKIRYNVLVLCTWFFHYRAIMNSKNVFFFEKGYPKFLDLAIASTFQGLFLSEMSWIWPLKAKLILLFDVSLSKFQIKFG